MNLISTLFNKIFAKKETKPTDNQSMQNMMAQMEKERAENIKNSEARLKTWLISYLKEKNEMMFSWESGNDEAFVSFDGNSYANNDEFEILEYHIIEKLRIPDAGEFQMNGNGIIYMTEKSVNAKYNSTIKDLIDYNEETEEETYSEEEVDSGDVVLLLL